MPQNKTLVYSMKMNLYVPVDSVCSPAKTDADTRLTYTAVHQ